MKQHLTFIAGMISALSLASCAATVDKITEPAPAPSTYRIHFTTENPSAKTNMTIDGENVNIYWDEQEDIRVWENEDEGLDVATITEADGSSASFSASFDYENASPYVYHAVVASKFDESGNPVLPSVQYPLPDSYDPNAEILVGKTSEPYAERPDEVSLRFGRAVVLAKMQLTGFENDGEKVSSVIFEATNNISGSVVADYVNAAATYDGPVASNRIEMIYAENNTISAGKTFDTYFTAYPGNTGGFKIIVKTDRNIYTKDLSAASFTFELGTVANLGINLASGTVKAPIALITRFTDKNWNTVDNSWSKNNAGYQFSNVNSGVWVTTATTGAGASSAATFSRVDSVTVRYCTNKTTGAGSITVTKGSDELVQNFTSSGGSASRYLKFDFSENNSAGKLTFTVNVTENSVYIQEIVVYGTNYLDPELTLDKTSVVLLIGGVISISGSTAYDSPTINYVSDNTSVATVSSDGTIITYSMGNATITAYVEAGTHDEKDYTSAVAYCYVSVKESLGSPTNVSGSILDCYELPAVFLEKDDASDFDSGQETYGNTNWYLYRTPDEDNYIIVHTFEYDCQDYDISGERINYVLYYNVPMKCALWAACEMNGTIFPANESRNDAWCQDPAISTVLGHIGLPDLSTSYYSDGSGNSYDRGHQIAAGDRLTTSVQNQQTFYYSNMTPQNPSLNRGAWKSLETAVQGLGNSTTGHDKLLYVTGPIFDEGYLTTGSRTGSCPVPTRYFKCVMQCTFDEAGNMTDAKGAAYIMNNEPGALRQPVSIDYVESITGFDFFSKVPEEYQSEAESTSYIFF